MNRVLRRVFFILVAYAAPELGHTQTEAHRRPLDEQLAICDCPSSMCIHMYISGRVLLWLWVGSASIYLVGATTAQRMPYATGSRLGQVCLQLLRSWVVAQLVALPIALSVSRLLGRSVGRSLGLSVCLLGCCAVGPT